MLLRRVAFALDERRVASFMEDVTQLVDAERDRTAVLDRLLDVADDERRALADGLHDDVIQRLAGVLLDLERLRRRAVVPEVQDGLVVVGAGIRDAVEHLRSLIFELAPPDIGEVGLAPTLHRLADQLLAPAGLEVALDLDLPDGLDDHVAAVVYRVLAEALVNVRKHARASTVRVSVQVREDRLVAEVVDDGIGPGAALLAAEDEGVVAPGHLGVRSMVDRCRLLGGELHIGRAAGGGTSVRLDVPALERLPDRVSGPGATRDWRPPGAGDVPLRRVTTAGREHRWPSVDVAALVHATPDLVMCFDRDLVLRYVNPSVARRQRTVAERYLGRSALEMFPHGIGEQASGDAAAVLRTGQPFRRSITVDDRGAPLSFDALLLPDRRAPEEPVWRVWAWVRLLANPPAAGPVEVRLPPPSPDGFEDLVPPSRVAEVLDGSSDLVACFDDSWRFRYVNQSAGLLLRRPAGQLVGRRPGDVGVHQRMVRPEAAEGALRTGRPQQFRAPIRVEHVERHADVVVVPVAAGGDRSLWVVARVVAAPQEPDPDPGAGR